MNRRENVAATLACGLAVEIVRTFGEVRLRVFGTSMVPSILPGDLISVQRAGISDLTSGDIVLYSREGRMFAHRVVGHGGSAGQPLAAQGESLLITRGDRLRYNDPPVSSSELLGRVIAIDRGEQQVKTSPKAMGLRHPLLRLLQTSDRATYIYLRLASLWGRFVGRTFRSDYEVGPREGLLSPEASGAKAPYSLAMNAGAKAPTHNSDESFESQLRAQGTEEVVECRA
jgi:signal peptidase I